MAVRVRPVKKRTTTDPSRPENAVHFYRRDIDVRPRSTGSFLGAFVRYGGVQDLYCQCFGDEDYDDFVGRVGRLHQGEIACHFVPPGAIAPFDDAPILRISEGAAAPLMWRRQSSDPHAYSVVSEITTLRLSQMDQMLGELLTAPAQPWDAMIFPSKSLRVTAERAIERYAEHLSARFGQGVELQPKRFVIPPGIHAETFHPNDQMQKFGSGVRDRLGIGREDLCVLAAGNFSFYERQHPTSLLLSLEGAARRTGVRLHLLMAGWFDSDRVERSYRDAARQFAPGVNVVFLDGRDPEIRNGAFAAADVYAAFDDSIHQIVEAELLEAMARGLPVVASDWGSNSDFIRHEQDGYLIPTWMPIAESVQDVTLSPEVMIDGRHDARADTFLAGISGQVTGVDVRAGAEAFAVLADDPDHRQSLGQSAHDHTVSRCDWPVVIRRHQAVWSELRRIRNAAGAIGERSTSGRALPSISNPFMTFDAYATHTIDGGTLVSLASGIRSGEGLLERLERLRANPLNTFSETHMLDVVELEAVLQSMNERRASTVTSLSLALADARQYLLPRTLAWLAKMGLVVITKALSRERSVGDAADEERDDDLDPEHEDDLEIDQSKEPEDMTIAADDGYSTPVTSSAESQANSNLVAPSALEQQLQSGRALLLRGDHKAGIAELQQAVDMAPESPLAHYLLGAALRRVGAAADAVRHLERSIKLNRRQIDALLHLAHARKSIGRRAEALQAFRDALRLEPANLFARAGEQSLGVEQSGRKRLEQDAYARRVALHFSGPIQFHPFLHLFDALQSSHWPLISSDGRTLNEFKPDVIVSGGTDTKALRSLFPDATVVAAPTFLASQNRFPDAFDGADIVCAPSELLAETWQRSGYVSVGDVRVTGYLPLDRIFAGTPIATPPIVPNSGATVLFAPTKPVLLSGIDMLAEDPAGLLRGAREDVTLVLKFHPDVLAENPDWLASWFELADRTPGMFVISDPDADMLPYLAAADVLVTDASSVMFEFLAIDRPILLLRNPEAAADPAFYDPQGIEWRWREVAREITDVTHLAQAVDLALKTPSAGEEIRASYRAALFGPSPGGDAAARIVDVITDLST